MAHEGAPSAHKAQDRVNAPQLCLSPGGQRRGGSIIIPWSHLCRFLKKIDDVFRFEKQWHHVEESHRVWAYLEVPPIIVSHYLVA
jgi:hypothetical protein